jgi:hypothetical protein
MAKLAIPQELLNRIPSGFLTAAGLKLPVNLFSFCLACGFLSGFENRNGWTYFVGALVSPLLTAIYFVVFPFNPYRTPAAKFSGMYDKDKSDETCQRYAELMRSNSARRVVLRNALILSLLMLSAMIAISVVQDKPISWTLHGDSRAWFPLLTLLSSLALVPIFVNTLTLWSLKVWATQQA